MRVGVATCVARAVWLCVLLNLSGCSYGDKVLPPVAPVGAHESSGLTNLEVDEVINDGRLLHLVGTVRLPTSNELIPAQQELSNPSQYALRFSGYGRDGLVREHVQSLPEAMIPSGGEPVGSAFLDSPKGLAQPARVYLALPAEGLASYQLELLWGGEARAALKVPPMPIPAAPRGGDSGYGLRDALRFESVEFEESDASCSDAGCSRGAPLRVVLVNGGLVAVSGIDARISFSRADCVIAGETSAAVRAESKSVSYPVALKPLRVAAGERRVIKLRVPLQVLQGIGLPWECAPQASLEVASVEFEPPVS